MIKRRIYWPQGEVDTFYSNEQIDYKIEEHNLINNNIPIDYIMYISEGKSTTIFYNGYFSEELANVFNIQPYHDVDQGYEIEIENGNIFFKLYDKSLINHPLPELQPGTKIANMIVVYNSAGISKMREIEYVLNEKWYRLCYDVDSLTIVSTSQYEVEENEL